MTRRKRRAFFTRRGPAPEVTRMWGLRGVVPMHLWAFFGLLPGLRQRLPQEPLYPHLTREDYVGRSVSA